MACFMLEDKNNRQRHWRARHRENSIFCEKRRMVTKFSPYKEITIDMVDDSGTQESSQPEGARSVNPGDVDLASLASRLQQRDNTPPVGYVPGKTMLRDQVIPFTGRPISIG
jgi:hypothetical protein